MYSCICSSMFLFIIFFDYLDSIGACINEDDLEGCKYNAVEDTIEFYNKIKDPEKNYGTRWIAMYDGNWSLAYSTIDSNNRFLFSELSLEETAEFVKLRLFTLKNPDGVNLDPEGKANAEFDPSRSTKIIIHGWLASTNTSMVQSIKQAYLENENVNVIGVDWSTLSSEIAYLPAAHSTISVGRYIGYAIDNLVEKYAAQYSDFHIVGHSLGAHVAGWAGNSTKEKIGRITGLDPALPGFKISYKKLNKFDADFVDVIHTCSGLLGLSAPLGHVDFYPNGGTPFQPGCKVMKPVYQQACSHSKSHEYFAESISKKSKFSAVKCSDWEHFQSNNCEDNYVLMGEYVPREVVGVFYLITNENFPYSKGINGTIYTPKGN